MVTGRTLKLSNKKFAKLRFEKQVDLSNRRENREEKAAVTPEVPRILNNRSSAGYVINPEKRELITVNGCYYRRMAIRTHVLTRDDNLLNTVQYYVKPLLLPGDLVFISEKAVACTQHRAIPLTDIHPRLLARLLCKFVHKTPYGIGLGIPETMEMALRECGTGRILFAAVISAFGKLLRQRGWFYKVAGSRASSIDGPCDCTIPPYNRCVVLGPENPDETAKQLAEALGCRVAIVDINDLGAEILGTSEPDLDRAHLCEILRDNPLGQGCQSTPMGIVREL